MEINVHDDRKIVEIWLSHSEQADAALREQLRPIYQEYNGKKYTVAVFQSGTEDLYEQVVDEPVQFRPLETAIRNFVLYSGAINGNHAVVRTS